MLHSHILTLFNFLILIFKVCDALNCSNPPKVIHVNKSGQGGSFKTIQSAIESIPTTNSQWTHIQIDAGIYTENIVINRDRPCILLQGAGSSSTIIQWSDHYIHTFESSAEYVVAKGITFENAYNNPPAALVNRPVTQAVAASIRGDKNAFYNCSFKGVQDTLLDNEGRHYFKNCYIQGAMDFIFGDGQSIYEKSVINFTMWRGGPNHGYITAQSRNSIDSPTGFVFKKCNITGTGTKMAMLGRAWGPFSRVIIANSYLTNVVRPIGWSSWGKPIANITYVEEGNKGPGADTTPRVKWMKKMNAQELNDFLSISYIDKEGWIANLP